MWDLGILNSNAICSLVESIAKDLLLYVDKRIQKFVRLDRHLYCNIMDVAKMSGSWGPLVCC